MSINLQPVKVYPPVKSNNNVNFSGLQPLKVCGVDEFCLSSKQKLAEVKFKGVWGKLFPPKVDSKLLKEYASLVKIDPLMNDTATITYKFGTYPVVKITPGEKKFTFELGFNNPYNKFIKAVEAEADLKTSVLTIKSVDNLDFNTGDVKYAVNSALRDAIWVYKNASELSKSKLFTQQENLQDVTFVK